MAHFTIPVYGVGADAADIEIKVDFEQFEDNLYFNINGEEHAISLYFEGMADGTIHIALGQTKDAEWLPSNEIPIRVRR